MNNKEFDEVFKEVVSKCEKLLCHKADEYSSDEDRLHNFNIAAKLCGETPVEALGGMMVKHTVSVYDLISKYGCGEVYAGDPIWDEKIIDSMNYLILLKAVLRDAAYAEMLINATFDTIDKTSTDSRKNKEDKK